MSQTVQAALAAANAWGSVLPAQAEVGDQRAAWNACLQPGDRTDEGEAQ